MCCSARVSRLAVVVVLSLMETAAEILSGDAVV
jgi:hypothetical protein